MTVALIFVDEHGVATGGDEGAPAASAFALAIHKKVGVRQPDVPSHGGGAGLAFWGWLRGLSFG